MLEEEQELTTHHSIKDISILKGILGYIKPYRVSFALIIIFDIVLATSFSLEPLIVKYMVDYLTNLDSTTPFSESMKIISIYISADIACWLIYSIGTYFVSLNLKRLGQKIVRDMRNDMFNHILSLSQKQLRELKIGSYVTRVTNDTQNLSSLFSDVLPQMLRAFFTLLSIIVATFIITAQEGIFYFGFLFLAYIPVIVLISYFFRRKAKKYYREEKNSISEMNSFLSETFQGIKVIKTFEREDKKTDEFDEKNSKIYSSFLHSQRLFAFYYPFMNFLQITSTVILMLLTLPTIVKGDNSKFTIGTFYLLYSYSMQFFQPLLTIANLMNQFESILTSAERIIFVLNEKIEIEDTEDSIDVPSFKGKIEFRNVCFAYEKDNYVLNNVSFVIEPGESVAFVGATGAGKSTIISLISRTYEIDSGQILIDDVDIKKYSLDTLRRNIGVMLQDVFLFSGTIEDNISLGDSSVTDDKVKEACCEIGAEEMILRLENGYETKVKERGANFSAGERQLISFARTLVYNPSLVLLDEATANIDTETERTIQKAIQRMKRIGTMVIVAHRLSTIKDCNRIFVVDKGEIKEEGNHDELLAKNGIYYHLYRLQNMKTKIDQGDLQHEEHQTL